MPSPSASRWSASRWTDVARSGTPSPSLSAGGARHARIPDTVAVRVGLRRSGVADTRARVADAVAVMIRAGV
jgi:hypothetical protein